MSSTRTKRYRKKPTEDIEEEDTTTNNPQSTKTETPAEVGESLEDILELRKLRRRQPGIDAERLQIGEPVKKKKGKTTDTWKQETGGLVTKEELAAREDEEDGSLIKDIFTKQTNALDVDKHMMAYIESELEKRRGGGEGFEEEDETTQHLDPRDQLYQTPDHLKIQKPQEKEENVTQSTAMLTAIPEVDLGIDARLKNIERTEKAKRSMMESRSQRKASGEFGGSNHVATERFWRGGRPPQSDNDRNRTGRGGHGRGRGGEQRATDDIVVERFKKKMRRF